MAIKTPPIKENVNHDSDLDAVSEGEDGGPHIKKKVLRSAKKEVTETRTSTMMISNSIQT